MLFIMINIVYIGVKYVNYSANVSSIVANDAMYFEYTVCILYAIFYTV